jgi:(p)ppGpp synthase/HD superfamily hydrolase
MSDLDALRNLDLSHYILKATALIGIQRQVGGNQFRHAFSTLGILIDYKYFRESVLLKASLLHDLLEEIPNTDIGDLMKIDSDSWQVVDLVQEVSKRPEESKPEFLERILHHGSRLALLLKCADRISNLTDLHMDTQTNEKFMRYLHETEQYIIPMAEKVNPDMVIELKDLVEKRREILLISQIPWFKRLLIRNKKKQQQKSSNHKRSSVGGIL